MRTIDISDVTLKYAQTPESGIRLNFREKIEIAKLMDKLNVSAIELPAIENEKVDSLLVKSIVMSVKNSVVALPVGLDQAGIQTAWAAVKGAKHARLQVCAPMSTVQMEYFRHKKPEAMLKVVAEQIKACRALCQDVEFIAEDACRADTAYIAEAVKVAWEAGAGIITLMDSAGLMFPDEMSAFIGQVRALLPEDCGARLGICCKDNMSMADACACAAVRCGVDVVKTGCSTGDITDLKKFSSVFRMRSVDMEADTVLRYTEIGRVTGYIESICNGAGAKKSESTQAGGDDITLSVHDSRENVMKVISEMGYALSDEDAGKVYEAFMNIAEKKENVSRRELESIIATTALQVPETYTLVNYVINSSKQVAASAHIVLEKEGRAMEGITLGDGPIDAAFHCVEQIVGRHFELDDFGISAVTEGREAMGESMVRLRANGKLYSGRGISTDIVASSIRAYLSALNKIVYEENEQ